ncbi:MAG: C40 family peptidase [Azoarcus sp.]|nr:C40 family peptidase [Azoarcus sp.]
MDALGGATLAAAMLADAMDEEARRDNVDANMSMPSANADGSGHLADPVGLRFLRDDPDIFRLGFAGENRAVADLAIQTVDEHNANADGSGHLADSIGLRFLRDDPDIFRLGFAGENRAVTDVAIQTVNEHNANADESGHLADSIGLRFLRDDPDIFRLGFAGENRAVADVAIQTVNEHNANADGSGHLADPIGLRFLRDDPDIFRLGFAGENHSDTALAAASERKTGANVGGSGRLAHLIAPGGVATDAVQGGGGLRFFRDDSDIFRLGFTGKTHPGALVAADEESEPEDGDSYNPIRELLDESMRYLGIRYRMGGTSTQTGFDCSGLVLSAFRNALGLQLPHSARALAIRGSKVDRHNLQPGDLVFFSIVRRTISHVGIYIGDGKFLHAPASGGRVRIEPLATRYWAQRYTTARRLIADNTSVSPLSMNAIAIQR